MDWFGLVWARWLGTTLALGLHCSMSSKHPRSRGTQVPRWWGLEEHSPARHVSWHACAVG